MRSARNLYRTPADTAEHVVTPLPCFVHSVRPDLTTSGTIKLRNTATAAAGTPVTTMAAALPQAGKSLDGMYFDTGLTAQLSNAADLSLIVWEPA